MRPGDLRAESFATYPPQARALAVGHLDALKRMPLVLLVVVLRQVIQYDWSFPAERDQLQRQLQLLNRMDASTVNSLMADFAAIPLADELAKTDWVSHPQQLSERLTAYLWAQHLSDKYHAAVQAYQQYLQKALPQPAPITPRWTIVVIGRGSQQPQRPLFRHLSPYGTVFTKLDPKDALETLVAEVAARAHRHPLDYGHWYIDGGEPDRAMSGNTNLTVMSYNRLVPAAKRELSLLNQFTSRSTIDGPTTVEAVSSYIAGLHPDDVGLNGSAADAPLRNFEVNVLTQGAGCQIFSTTFVQWASRECLHRAQPLTLLARFATRQRNAPMEQLLARDPLQQPQDPQGSLVDADMGAYYTWVNQSRLPNHEESRFLVWFEDHTLACAISPTLPAGTRASAPMNMREVLKQMS
jgi:hypothetical protein